MVGDGGWRWLVVAVVMSVVDPHEAGDERPPVQSIVHALALLQQDGGAVGVGAGVVQGRLWW